VGLLLTGRRDERGRERIRGKGREGGKGKGKRRDGQRRNGEGRGQGRAPKLKLAPLADLQYFRGAGAVNKLDIACTNIMNIMFMK